MDGYVVDKGIFKDNPRYKRKLPESFLVIENWMNTIGEYQQYAKQNTPSWDEYFQAVFQVMGFNIQKINNRIFELRNMGDISFPCAVVGFVNPGENLDFMVPGFNWVSLLFYVANYHQVEWGILFNGTEMKIYNLKRKDYQFTNVIIYLYKILSEKQADSFIEFCNMLSVIRNDSYNGLGTSNFKSRKGLEELIPEFRGYQLGLTKRELEILQTIQTGMTNDELADTFNLKSGVVRNYLSSIYKKLEVKNRTGAIKKARDLGLIDE